MLCAHRRGPFGVAWWNRQFEDWLAGDGPRLVGTYVGRPVLVTANDAIKGLSNGDLGVVVRPTTRAVGGVPRRRRPRLVAPARVEAVETVHAMTIHKSQGSEFDEIVVVLPPAESRLATRELLYTAVTRARKVVTLVGGEAAVRRAIDNRVVRQTGLRQRLWPDGRLSQPPRRLTTTEIPHIKVAAATEVETTRAVRRRSGIGLRVLQRKGRGRWHPRRRGRPGGHPSKGLP